MDCLIFSLFIFVLLQNPFSHFIIGLLFQRAFNTRYNIYVGTLTVNNSIEPESETHSPGILAEKFWEMYVNQDEVEIQY